MEAPWPPPRAGRFSQPILHVHAAGYPLSGPRTRGEWAVSLACPRKLILLQNRGQFVQPILREAFRCGCMQICDTVGTPSRPSTKPWTRNCVRCRTICVERFARICELIGPSSVSSHGRAPRHLTGPLWEMRIRAAVTGHRERMSLLGTDGWLSWLPGVQLAERMETTRSWPAWRAAVSIRPPGHWRGSLAPRAPGFGSVSIPHDAAPGIRRT